MVFEWFFGKKGKHLFNEFMEELKNLELIDVVLNKSLNNEPVYKKETRTKIEEIMRKLENQLQEFINRINNQRDKLNLYISTSIEEHDYLSEIEEINEKLMNELQTIHSEFHKDDFWKFIEESEDIRTRIHEQVEILEEKMGSLRTQSRNSLEWNYNAGTGDIDMKFFKKCVSNLGGKIDPSMGKGDHFGVVFDLFTNTIGPKRGAANMIDAGTFVSFINQREDLITPHFDKKYIICFFNHNIRTFRRTFLRKYKDLFEV